MRLNRNQTGAASLITVIFIAILLSILTIGFIRIAINEQRTATDDDLTTRAYFAAESGVEDAKRAIKDYIKNPSNITLNEQLCDHPSGGSGFDPVLSQVTDYDVEYTCQLIDLTPSNLRVHMDGVNQTFQFPLSPVDGNGAYQPWNTVTVRWHINDDLGNDGDTRIAYGSGGPITHRGNTDTSLEDVSTWNGNNNPAMLDVHFFQHPTGNFGRGAIADYRSLLSPNNATAGNSAVENVFNGNAVAGSSNDGTVISAACSQTTAIADYFCEKQFRFNGTSAARQVYIRLTNLYRATHVEIEISQGATPRLLADAQAVVDVTGRAGDVFRRVETTLDLTQFNILPDFAIISAEDICKDFGITDEAVHFSGIDGTSCTQPGP